MRGGQLESSWKARSCERKSLIAEMESELVYDRGQHEKGERELD